MIPASRQKRVALLTESEHARRRVADAIASRGLGWLTDEQLADLCGDYLAGERRSARLNRSNRAMQEDAA